MPGFAVSERIDRPPSEVWNCLTDLERAPRWMKGIAMIALDEDGPLRVGTVYRFRVKGLSDQLKKGTVTGLVPGRELHLSSTQGRVAADYTYRLEPDGNGTAISLTASCTVDGPLRLVAPLISVMMKHFDGGQLRDLKRLPDHASEH